MAFDEKRTKLGSQWILVLFALALAPVTAYAERINAADFVYDKERAESTYSAPIRISKDIVSVASMTVSSKGNGALRMDVLEKDLRIYDYHSDVAYYENGLLDTDFVDLNGDGYKDLIVSGVVCYSHEKDDTVLLRENVVFVYLFSVNKRTFRLSYRNASFRLEDGPTGKRSLSGNAEHIKMAIKEGRKQAQQENAKRVDAMHEFNR